jgi:hypothetical protein
MKNRGFPESRRRARLSAHIALAQVFSRAPRLILLNKSTATCRNTEPRITPAILEGLPR